MTGNNVIAGLMSGFLGTPGDLMSRILFYNCSIDKPWTMLFFLPPMSFVTGMLYFLDKIEKGTESCGTAFDAFVVVIPFLTILFKMGFDYLIKNKMLSTAVSFFLIITMYAAIRMVKYNSRCQNMFKDKYKGFGKLQITNAITVSVVTNLLIMGLNLLAPFCVKIPIIGIAFRIWALLKKIPGLQIALPLTFSHVITNLIENNKSKMLSICCNQSDGCQ